jgi:hypothetical protein
MSADADPFRCTVDTISGRDPPCEGATRVPVIGPGTLAVWCMEFPSASAFIAWVRSLDDAVILEFFDDVPDGVPVWSVTIYDERIH